MQRIATTTQTLGRVLAVCGFASALWACHSSTTPQLADARRAYDDAEDSPARTYARDELVQARRALDRAEQAHDDDPGSNREAQLGYLAGRKAEIARAHGEMAAAERAKAQAKVNADYQAKLARDARRGDRTADVVQRPAPGDRSVKIDRDGEKTDVALRPERERRPASDRRRDADRAAAAMQNVSQVASVKEEPRGVVLTISGGLLFPTGEQELSPIARSNLDQVADALAAQPSDRMFLIAGHTDSSGSQRENQRLSEQRAQAVADHLMQRGIDDDRMRVVGYGESQPIASNDTAEGRSANRRIEIVVTDRDGVAAAKPAAAKVHGARAGVAVDDDDDDEDGDSDEDESDDDDASDER